MGTEYKNSIIEDLCKYLHIKNITSTAHHHQTEDLTETNPKIEEQDLNNLTIPAVLMSDLDNSTDSDDNSIIENKTRNNITMAQSNIDFINTASKLIPVFDGKSENLTSFMDALEIIESIKGEHERFNYNNKAKRCRQKSNRR